MILPKKTFGNIFIILGIVGILDFVFLLIISAVINLGILFPGVAGAILLSFGILLHKDKIPALLLKNTIIRGMIITVFLLGLSSFIIVEAFILSAVKPDSNVQVDYLIILGAGLKGDQMTLTFKNRVDKGIEFLYDNPDVKVIVSGGQGLGETITEAEAMSRYLIENGIEQNRIIKEDKSTSTFENFKFTRELLLQNSHYNKYKLMIVTSDFHMFRAKMIGRRNGFITYGLPSKTWLGILPNSCIREYFALIKSFFMDK